MDKSFPSAPPSPDTWGCLVLPTAPGVTQNPLPVPGRGDRLPRDTPAPHCPAPAPQPTPAAPTCSRTRPQPGTGDRRAHMAPVPFSWRVTTTAASSGQPCRTKRGSRHPSTTQHQGATHRRKRIITFFLHCRGLAAEPGMPWPPPRWGPGVVLGFPHPD